MKEFLSSVLPGRYGWTLHTVEEVAGGWSAAAFVVGTNRGRYFVKVYDKRRPSVRPWIERMAWYLPVVAWLYDHTPLRDRMIAPIRTQTADYVVESAAFAGIVFPLVKGQALGGAPLSADQIHQIAQTLALLHSYGGEIPVPTAPLTETFSLPFLDSLDAVVHRHGIPPALGEVLQAHSQTLPRAMAALRGLADQMRDAPPPFALCHTDIHGGNLMWDNRLILIDWEGLRLAPVESDLFSFSNGFFYGDAGSEFFAAYQNAHPDYIPNAAAMHYYRLRRRVEDISEFCSSIAGDDLTPAELAAALHHLQRECEALGDVING